MMIKKAIILSSFLCLALTLRAQYSVYNEIWLEAGIQGKLFKGMTGSLAEGYRMHEGISGQSYTDLGLDYKLNKHLQIGGGYRYIQKPFLFSIYEFDHRFTLDATVSYKTGDLSFSFRPRFQHRLKGISADDGKRSKTYNRNKFSAQYSISKKVNLELNYEFFYRLSGSGNFIDQNRYSLELSYRVSKEHRLKVFYMLQQEIQVTWPELTHVSGLEYSYRF